MVAGLVGTFLQADRSVGVVGALLWAALLGTIAALVARAFVAVRVTPRAAAVASSTLVILYAFVDFLDLRIFAQHIDRAQFLAAVSAVRTRAVRVGIFDVGILVAAVAFLVALLYGLERLIARLTPRPLLPRRRHPGLGAVLAALAILALFTRDVTSAKDSAPLFWHAAAPVVPAGPVEESPFHIGADLVSAEASILRDVAANPGSLEPSAAQRKNILLVHIESLRSDMLNETNMPKLFAWTKRAWRADHHYSTGNNTVGGFFGAISGLNATYFYPATKSPGFHALPLEVLRQLGYQRHIWFPNEALLLDDMVEKIVGPLADAHPIKVKDRAEADRDTVRAYLDALAASTGPRFDYLALDSTHYEYQYPAAFERFTPVSTFGLVVENGVMTQKVSHAEWETMRTTRGAGVFNAYKNSVLWVDTVLDQLFTELDRNGRLDTMAVALFGDHGEEFWERGSWGHSTRFDEQQVRTPLLLFPATDRAVRYVYSSHADIMPTIFAMLGIRSKRAFMNGKSLFDYDPARDFVLLRNAIGGTYDDQRNAIVFDGMKLVFFDGADPKVIAVRHANDDEWADAPRDLVSRAMAAAVGAKELH